ncbi:beta-1,3-galactosyl-O-glycosyl-glycoprotein beta-1,6-N-acetylglucosaminyltransferase-like [Mizuhopecten yessoensis]|uniref:Beta-1,3-galactosyl-O-glycosyl-glycoprotein beta-1,6-N-acetylglucosaminyltransferase n=1 Tax=Mizuhopecten yessoensis TaxID=6573 RepID=A0A210R0E7_MIZYE|nr:beta-1,3-galactosyl-O-glycosyl-glycoprotein beta-1,6-N-acetylglucosaminyltransferase-like [Mizuhopecten yessoensis]OWF54385.1 Beta-1,3-galactosyl-O-glycosyl-glycoprotein beta-1,6-N-acetylglucosaminyltransferase [Mizuhopecten yessoensis]
MHLSQMRIGYTFICAISLTSVCLGLLYQILITRPILNGDKSHLILPSTSRPKSNRPVFSYRRTRVDINCSALFDGVESELLLGDSRWNITSKQYVSDDVYIEETVDCDSFIVSRDYITSPLTEEEELFSIAYSLVVYKDANQVERLLRTLYRPQNYYCIHMDVKSSPVFRRAISGVAKCFPNVFISSQSVSVKRKSYTVLQPDLICMEYLWKYRKWKYLINVAGNEFPLRTNLEIVQILKTLNGSNHIQGIIKAANTNRWTGVGAAPHNIRPVKGSMHIVASRGFVDYILHDPVAHDFMNWTRHTDYPEETFFPSLNYNPHLNVPGGFKGNLEENEQHLRFFGRFVNWVNWIHNTDKYKADYACYGKIVHGICIFGVRDLPLIITRPELFVNKFYRYYQPYVMDCLEELLFNRSREDYFDKRTVNTDVYAKQYGWTGQ